MALLNKKQSKHNSTSIIGFFNNLLGDAPKIRREKARLEAFLAAVPGEYCGFSSDQSIAYSQGFCTLLNLVEIHSLVDIQNRLTPGDAAALESLFGRMQEKNTSFTLTTTSHDHKKHYEFSGSCGQDLNEQDYFYILWIKDITKETQAQKAYSEDKNTNQKYLKRLESSLNTIHRPIWLRDDKQALIWVNKAYAESTGLSAEEIIKTQKELATPTRKKKSKYANDLTPGKTLAAHALSHNTINSVKAHVIVKGNRLLMDISEIPMKEINTTLGMALNITREENLETELERHQTSNKELLEQLGTAISIYDSEKKLEFYNAAFARLWGIEDGWLNTKPSLGALMEKLREARRLPEQADFKVFKKSWLDMFTGLIDPHEDMLYLPDGTTLRMACIPHSMGGLMMTFEDVTSNIELESSYNTLIAVQQETLDNLGEGVAVFGENGRLRLSNPSYGRLWDLNPEDVEGEPHISTIIPKFKKFFTEKEWGTRKEELISKSLDRILHEGRHERIDGTLIDFSTVPLPDGGVMITYSDVTDTVRVEQALRDKNTALETAEKLKLDFLANVSYQLRTPLNAIMGFNEILDQEYFGPLNPRQKEYTNDISRASNKLLTLINDILDLSTIEAGQLKLNPESIKIYNMLNSLTNLVREWSRKEQIEVLLKCPKNIGTIIADKQRIKQIIINLIRNAITFTPAGGTITISAKRLNSSKGHYIILCVSDTGIGMTKEDQTQIFQPFEHAASNNTISNKKHGAGLGLTLVKNITELHGGLIEIESEKDKGTAISILLPIEKVEKNKKTPKNQNITT